MLLLTYFMIIIYNSNSECISDVTKTGKLSTSLILLDLLKFKIF